MVLLKHRDSCIIPYALPARNTEKRTVPPKKPGDTKIDENNSRRR